MRLVLKTESHIDYESHLLTLKVKTSEAMRVIRAEAVTVYVFLNKLGSADKIAQ